MTRKDDGSPRRTVDLSPMNKHCEREIHTSKSPFNLARSVPDNSVKTVYDAWNGYHSVPIREEDRHLTTFTTPWGLFRYKRAPQGFISSGDGYNRRFDDLTAHMPRMERCVDDTLIHDAELAAAAADKAKKNKAKFTISDEKKIQLEFKLISAMNTLKNDTEKSDIYNFLKTKNYKRVWSGILNHIFVRN